MFIAVSSLRAVPEIAKSLEKRFHERKKLVDTHPGFRRLQLLRGRGTTEYMLILEWDSFAEFQAYAKSPDFDHAHADLDSGVEALGLRMYDTVVDSSNGG